MLTSIPLEYRCPDYFCPFASFFDFNHGNTRADKSILPFPGNLSNGEVFPGAGVVQTGALAGSLPPADQPFCIHAIRDGTTDVRGSPFHGTPAAHDGCQTRAQLSLGTDEADVVPVSRVHRCSFSRCSRSIHSTYEQMSSHMIAIDTHVCKDIRKNTAITGITWRRIATSHVKDGTISNTPRKECLKI